MDNINKFYNNSEKCIKLKNSILDNIEGRVCHTRVLVLYILCELYDIKNYLEIGVHNGASMSFVVSHPKVNKCIGIDLFENTFGHYIKDNITFDRSKSNILSNCINNKEIIFIKGNSKNDETLKQLEHNMGNDELDLLFIDGDHSYESVKSDFTIYERYVRHGGLIVFDDYHWTSIRKFIDEIKYNPKYQIIGLFDNTEFILLKI